MQLYLSIISRVNVLKVLKDLPVLSSWLGYDGGATEVLLIPTWPFLFLNLGSLSNPFHGSTFSKTMVYLNCL